MNAYELALIYFRDWEIDYALKQRQEAPAKVLARMANESLRGHACPKYLVETMSGKVKYFAGSWRTRKEQPDLEVTTIKLARIALTAPRQLNLDLKSARSRRPRSIRAITANDGGDR